MTSLTKEDYKKLKRLIRCIIGSIDKLFYLGASNLSVILNFIAAAYDVCDNIKSYTRDATTLGYSVFSLALLK